jgi:hypothetical protein
VLLERARLIALGRAHAAGFRAASPWPHVVIDGFCGEAAAGDIAAAFPPADHARWKRRDYAEQRGRLGQLQRGGFDDLGAPLQQLLLELGGGMAMLEFLGALLGRDDLIGDPHFVGAGPLLTLPGGHLAVHADFNRDSARKLDRVASVLYYAPAVEWDAAAWGGELELWDRGRGGCEVAIAPVRDRLVVLAYGEDHWHGHPSPVRCPEGVGRAVVAAIYYAARAGEGDGAGAHGAIW